MYCVAFPFSGAIFTASFISSPTTFQKPSRFAPAVPSILNIKILLFQEKKDILFLGYIYIMNIGSI